MWEQVQADIAAGHAGQPVEVEHLDLNRVLLVDSSSFVSLNAAASLIGMKVCDSFVFVIRQQL